MKDDVIESGQVADDQAAEFAALQAGAVEAAPGAPGAPDVAPDISLASEFVGIAGALLAVMGPIFPSVKKLYTDDVTQAAAASLAAVCVKHGWLSGGLMGEYAEEMTALMVCGPLAFATVQAAKSDLADKSTQAPGAAQVAPGASVVDDPAAPKVLERG